MFVRFSFALCLAPPITGLSIAVIENILKGKPTHLGEPLFWAIFLPGVLLAAGLLWLIPWAKVREESITALDTIGRIRTVKWSEITRCAVHRLPGIVVVRLYEPASRFALWLYLPPSEGKVGDFIRSHATPVVVNALGPRSN